MSEYRYKKDIVKLLNEIIIALQEKQKILETEIEQRKLKGFPERQRFWLEKDLQYTKGQLFEARYILDTITRK